METNQVGSAASSAVDSVDQVSGDVQVSTSESQSGSVAYETHKRLLGQKKKTEARLEELERELEERRNREREAEEKSLAEQGEYKKLLELERKKSADLSTKMETTNQQLVMGTKYQAFVDQLPGELSNRKYLSLADVEKIAIDPETGEVDGDSVKMVVDDFVKEHARLLNNKKIPGVPNRASAPVSTATDPKQAKWDIIDSNLNKIF